MSQFGADFCIAFMILCLLHPLLSIKLTLLTHLAQCWPPLHLCCLCAESTSVKKKKKRGTTDTVNGSNYLVIAMFSKVSRHTCQTADY